MVEELESNQPSPSQEEEQNPELEQQQQEEVKQYPTLISKEEIESIVIRTTLKTIEKKIEELLEKGVVIIINNTYNYSIPVPTQHVQQVQQPSTPVEKPAAEAEPQPAERQPRATRASRNGTGRRHIVSLGGVAWYLAKQGLTPEEAQRRLPSFLEGRIPVGTPNEIYLIDERIWREASELYGPGAAPTATELSSQFGLDEKEAEMLAEAIREGQELSDDEVYDEFMGLFEEKQTQQGYGSRRGASRSARGTAERSRYASRTARAAPSRRSRGGRYEDNYEGGADTW